MNTPLLIIAYNRPKHLSQLINQLEKSKPNKIFLFCDGPKDSTDKEKVQAVHKCLSLINWKCSIETNFQKKNLGCQLGVETALNWFFSKVESGIVLEDDCLPHPDFFTFATKMLKIYSGDKRVAQITGYNAGYKSKSNYSYFFSSYSSSWGWASWRDRWENYSVFKKNGQKNLRSENVKSFLRSKHIPKGFYNNSLNALNGLLDSWAYIWSMSNLVNSRLTIISKENLIRNIGFGESSTHTKFQTSSAYLGWKPMQSKIIHPPCVIPELGFDYFEAQQHNSFFVMYDILKTFIRKKLLSK